MIFNKDDQIRIKQKYHKSTRSRIIRSVTKVNADGTLWAYHHTRGIVHIKRVDRYEIVPRPRLTMKEIVDARRRPDGSYDKSISIEEIARRLGK